MNKERVEHLREVLCNVPKERFTLDKWVCGTVACAVGWACQDKKFNEEGLQLTNPKAGMPKFGSRLGWDAVQEFFDLEDDTAEFLFAHSGYEQARPGPLDVVAHIDQVLEFGE